MNVESRPKRKNADSRKRRAGEATFEPALRRSGCGAFWLDADLRIVRANEAFARFAGRAAGDLIGAGIELIDPDWPHGPAAESFERLRTVKSIGHAARLRRPDGGAFPVQLHVNHVCFGEFETLFGVALDTSARQAAEDALRASEMRYRAVTEDQTEFIVRLRRDLVVTFCNPAYVRLVSARNAESILGLRAGDVGHPEGAGWMERCIAGLTPENPVANNVTSAPTPDGEDVWISWNVRAIYSDDPTADEPVDREPRDDDSRADQPPHVREYQAVGRDVTESRRMLAALTRAQKRYRSLVEDSPDLVSRWDAGGSLTFANRTYRQYFGLPVDPAGDPDDMNRYDAVTRERIERSLAKLSPEEPVARLVTAGRRHDGMLRQLEWVERGFFDERDRLTEMQSVGRDVTDQVAAEALLAESERRQRAVLDDLAEMVNRFRPGDGTITYANRAFLEAKKTDDEPIVGRMTIFDHLDGNERASVRARLAAVTPECPSVSALLELPGPDGNNRWEEWSNRAIFDPPDPAKPDAPRRISEFQSVGRDVTDELVARDRRKEQREAAAELAKLTPREREVLRVVVTGDTNKVIARKLKVTERTVEKHRGAAMRKLGVRSVAELIRAAIAAEEVSQRAERRLPKAPDEAPA